MYPSDSLWFSMFRSIYKSHVFHISANHFSRDFASTQPLISINFCTVCKLTWYRLVNMLEYGYSSVNIMF